jgi:hypothetical protein
MALSVAVAMTGRTRWWAAALAAALAAGCVVSDGHVTGKNGAPPHGSPCQIVMVWEPRVIYTPDPTHGGTPTPGLAGRLYLFGPRIDFPMLCEGSVAADLYDESDGKPVLRERLQIDQDNLKRLAQQDFLGWGYTLFWPLPAYRPEMSKLRLRVCYQAKNAAPLYTEDTLTLGEGNGTMQVTNTSTPLGKK